MKDAVIGQERHMLRMPRHGHHKDVAGQRQSGINRAKPRPLDLPQQGLAVRRHPGIVTAVMGEEAKAMPHADDHPETVEPPAGHAPLMAERRSDQLARISQNGLSDV